MDRTEIAGLYRDLGPVVYGRCRRLLGDPKEARDATQEVFVQVIRHAGKLDGARGYLPWLYRVATNHCLKRLRKRSREEPRAPEDLPQHSRTTVHGDDTAQQNLVRTLLGRVDERTGEIAICSHIFEMTQQEIAEAMGLSRRTVGKKLKHFAATSREFIGAEKESGKEASS